MIDRHLADARRRKDWPAVAALLQRAGRLTVGSSVVIPRGPRGTKTTFVIDDRFEQTQPFCWRCGMVHFLGPGQRRSWLRTPGYFWRSYASCSSTPGRGCFVYRVRRTAVLRWVCNYKQTVPFGGPAQWDRTLEFHAGLLDSMSYDPRAGVGNYVPDWPALYEWVAERAISITPPAD